MSSYLLYIIIPFVLGLWAQVRISRVYKRWSQVRSTQNITGAQAAKLVLESEGIHDVKVLSSKGHLVDHYDPSKRQLVLSEENYSGSSLAALGVAAHEAGHAIQHKEGYSFLKFRMALVPTTQIASQLLPFVIFGGFFLQLVGLIKIGVGLYLILTVFQLVTLPVEFDASARAQRCLVHSGLLGEREIVGVQETLTAAAWTYIAAFIASLGNLLYLLSLTRSNDD